MGDALVVWGRARGGRANAASSMLWTKAREGIDGTLSAATCGSGNDGAGDEDSSGCKDSVDGDEIGVVRTEELGSLGDEGSGKGSTEVGDCIGEFGVANDNSGEEGPTMPLIEAVDCSKGEDGEDGEEIATFS